jgi:plastocyanin
MLRRNLFAATGAALLLLAASAHAASPRRVEVTMQQFAFAPAEVSVPAGATVTWTNRDAVPHSVTASDGSFDSGPIEPGKSFEWTASQSAAYHCVYHPSMTGSLRVISKP